VQNILHLDRERKKVGQAGLKDLAQSEKMLNVEVIAMDTSFTVCAAQLGWSYNQIH